jgi:hypothetical protein
MPARISAGLKRQCFPIPYREGKNALENFKMKCTREGLGSEHCGDHLPPDSPYQD